ncbi:uncharacterized protein LOC112688090 [Sipha flava]|uniref:Uncharacterized protein LOC112688090 n=1 Tax=Sipha flava TaxID=143950 RepID=A0A8B8G0X6_9HEMI|nr:uncharacterized protein LOC112688090 [Sipha flava]
MRWLCTVRTCIAKVYTSSENIIQIVKIVNENNGHDQPSIYRKIYSNGCKRKVMQNLYTKPKLPKSKPVIVTDKDKYDPGDTLVANCTSPASRPAAGLTFFLNNMPIGSPETLKYSTSNFLKLSMLTVTLKLNQSHFKDGRKLLLQCTALINTLYKQSSELRLPIKSTEPVPEKVTSPSSGCRLTCSNKYLTMITTLVLLCNVFR